MIMTFQELLKLEESRFIDEELLDDYWYRFYEMEQQLQEEGKLIYYVPFRSTTFQTIPHRWKV